MQPHARTTRGSTTNLWVVTVEQIAALADNEFEKLFVDKQSTGQGGFVPIDFDKVFKVRTGHTMKRPGFSSYLRSPPAVELVNFPRHPV
ncbi:hypothetical protein BJP08_06335 [Corynebacterium sp. NML140438]|nr:hypothetical protein BJP08_06335 [Corynebacterium sp. NML140438]